MLIRKPADIRPSEITSKTNYLSRREFIRAGAIAGGSLVAGGSLAAVVPGERLVHHLLDNASLPHTMASFINASRRAANPPRYWGFDRGVKPQDCNVVRAHDFISLTSENFAKFRLRRCAETPGPVVVRDPAWSRTDACQQTSQCRRRAR